MDRRDGSLEADLASTISELQQRLAALEGDRDGGQGGTTVAPAQQQEAFGRRSLLRRVGVVAAGAAAATVVGGALRPAAAVTNDPMLVGNTMLGSTNSPQTTLKVTSLTSSASSIFAVTDGTSVTTSRKAAVAGIGGTIVDTGVAGTAAGSGSVGVLGQGETGFAAASNSVHLKLTDTAGNTTALPTTATVLARAGLPGEVIFDRSFNLWLGVSGSYRKLAGPSTVGALHVINPTRVYDSRSVSILANGTSRQVQVTNGGTIPTGARAILATLTVTGPTGSSGFLTITAGDVGSTAASSINWSSTGQDIATTVVSLLDTTGKIKMFNNSGSSTHFILDVTGYYL